jgi:hypothetical protein
MHISFAISIHLFDAFPPTPVGKPNKTRLGLLACSEMAGG